MSFDVTALAAYTDQQRFPLVTASVFSAKSISMANKQLGIKSSADINIVDTDARFQTGGTCSWNASGTTTFTQRVITVGKVAVMEEFCPETLEQYYLQTQLPSGSTYKNLPFEQIISEKKAGKIAEQLEKAVWQGNTASGDPNLSKFDGWLKIIDAATGPVTATAQASISSSTVRGIHENIYTLIPAAIIDKEDLVCFEGWDTFRLLLNKLTADNMYNYKTDDAAQTGELMYPGTTLKIVAVHGLDSTNRIIAARTSNLYFGTDMMNEEEQFRFFPFEDGSDAIRFKAKFKAGCQIAFPSEIVKYANS